MKIPKALKIGGHIYKIQFHKMGETCEERGDMAKTNRMKGIIELAVPQMKTEIEANFLHEILHIINGELSEETVEGLAQQLYQVLKDNKLIK